MKKYLHPRVEVQRNTFTLGCRYCLGHTGMKFKWSSSFFGKLSNINSICSFNYLEGRCQNILRGMCVSSQPKTVHISYISIFVFAHLQSHTFDSFIDTPTQLILIPSSFFTQTEKMIILCTKPKVEGSQSELPGWP